MPELPDVEIFRRRLAAKGLKRAIRGVSVRDPRAVRPLSPRRFAEHIRGRKFVATRRHGKHLLARLDKGGWMTMHFGMTGSLEFVGPKGKPPRFVRLAFDFARGQIDFADPRRLGRAGLTGDVESFIAKERLGPDALAPSFNLTALKQAVAGRKTSIKAALMDQSAVAGIGNIYSDEILFQARIDPRRQAKKLSGAELSRILRQIKRVFKIAIARGAGSEHFFERLPRSFILPQRKKGGKCPSCGGPVRLFKSGGRSGYYCPRCQS
jgi:formamidopyrimidine-DNA glycosylase